MRTGACAELFADAARAGVPRELDDVLTQLTNTVHRGDSARQASGVSCCDLIVPRESI